MRQASAALRGLLERAGLGGGGLPAKLAQMTAFGVTKPEVGAAVASSLVALLMAELTAFGLRRDEARGGRRRRLVISGFVNGGVDGLRPSA